MRNLILLSAMTFAVALAYIVGNRLSNEAIAVVVGTVCGISASIPVCIGLVIASSNNWGRQDQRDDSTRAYAQPPVVIVSPPQSPYTPYGMQQNPYYFPTPMNNATIESREFKVIGGE